MSHSLRAFHIYIYIYMTLPSIVRCELLTEGVPYTDAQTRARAPTNTQQQRIVPKHLRSYLAISHDDTCAIM